MKVKNFSRHPFNTDQIKALLAAGFTPDMNCENPFFESAEDLIQKTDGTISSIVAPMGMLLEALSKEKNMKWVVTIIDWTADKFARNRGRFATRGMKIFDVYWDSKTGNSVKMIKNVIISPTVENDFKTGAEIPYMKTN